MPNAPPMTGARLKIYWRISAAKISAGITRSGIPIAARSTLTESGWQLFEVLEHQSYDQMYRHHCAAALLYLMQSNRWHPDDLTHNEDHHLRFRLREFRLELAQKVRG